MDTCLEHLAADPHQAAVAVGHVPQAGRWAMSVAVMQGGVCHLDHLLGLERLVKLLPRKIP